MSRNRQPGSSAIERFQVSFSPLVAQESAFINEWFSRPWGRRQAWARGLAHLGLTARNSGHHLLIGMHMPFTPLFDGAVVADQPLGRDGSKSQPLTLTLHRKSMEDEACLKSTDLLPASRKCGWLRDTLLLGMVVQTKLPDLLEALGALNLAPNLQEPKENPSNAGDNGQPAPKVRENRKARAFGVDGGIENIEKVQDGGKKSPASKIEVESKPVAYVIDVDLSDPLPTDPTSYLKDSGTTTANILESVAKKKIESVAEEPEKLDGVKRPELLGLFN